MLPFPVSAEVPGIVVPGYVQCPFGGESNFQPGIDSGSGVIQEVGLYRNLLGIHWYTVSCTPYCRTNDTGLAANDLTTLSQSRGAGAVSIGTDWLETISDERVKELYMEGFRLNDLKRWGMGFERTPNSYSQTEGNDLEISADDPLFVWPIPQNDIEAPGSDIEGNESNNR